MKVLICAQAVDTQDLVLGFFVRWIEEFARHYERVSVICLKRGTFTLPENVSVYSLGKSAQGRSASGWERLWLRIQYSLRFYVYAWKLRKEYDVVFVHMNQEYVFLLGWFWKLLGKRVYMWRNHWTGSWLTDIAVYWCHKTFCTSKFSYIAKYAKNVLMPVGVDTDFFSPLPNVSRDPSAILSLGRIAPSKKVDVLLSALGKLKDEKISFSASVYGSPLPSDDLYYEHLQTLAAKLDLQEDIEFHQGIPNSQTPGIYNRHGIFVNCSTSGMYDKTMFEAMACECLIIASSRDLAGIIDASFIFDGNPSDLAHKLKHLLALSVYERRVLAAQLRSTAKRHSLDALARALIGSMERASAV